MSASPARRATALAGAAALALATLACTHPGHGHNPHPSTTTGAPTTSAPTTTEPATTTTTTPPAVNPVQYELANFTITLEAGTIQAGENAITVTNVGTAPHEIVFVKAAGAASLPTTANGAVDEAAIPAADKLGEIEAAPGATATGTLTFTPGSWVAFCNVGTHFARGMHVDFTVT
jgi:uncharacterized cupredoxin-like copper-binding protein